MVNVLIIDDDNERIRQIAASVKSDDVSVEYVMTKNEALCRLEEKEYDLVIIDIMLPENIDSLHPQPTAGIDIIKDIYERARILPPKCIVGVTSSCETFENSKDFFEGKLIPILIWNESDNLWKRQLLERINYLKLKKNNPSVDTVIVTAVLDEFEAVKNAFSDWQTYRAENDPAVYYMTEVSTNSGHTRKLLLIQLPEMGMTAASNAVTKVVLQFKPKHVYMVGICGGVRGDIQLCDVIVATETWDYGSGKIIPKNGDERVYYRFEASPNQIGLKPEMINNLRCAGPALLQEIANRWNSAHAGQQITPELKFSPMPSGASVISDPALFKEIIKPQHRKCKGFDMETYGVYFAVKHTSSASIDFVSIKAVSDFADVEKDDNYHAACCYLCSNLLKECMQNGVL